MTLPVDGSAPMSQGAPYGIANEDDSIVAPPLTVADGSESSHDTTSIAEASIEAEATDQESLELVDQQASAGVQIPIVDEGARIDAGNSTATDMGSEPAPSEPEVPLDERQIPSADAVGDAEIPVPDEAASAHDDTAVQAGEGTESTRGQDSLPDHPATENRDPDNPQNANVVVAASLAEAISVTQFTTRTYAPDPPVSDEQVSDGDLAALPSAQTTEADADTVDRDIAYIANSWPSPAISEALKRLRQARGLLPTDLSYDAGWITAFEAGRWHTYQSERQCYISGIRTYLQALGMTPAELQGYLPPLIRYQNGM